MQKKVAIIGCGASGMSAAYHLLKQGVEIHVFEKEDKIGGRMATQKLNGKDVCLGGKNIGRKYHIFREFCKYFGEDNFEDFGLNTSNHQGSKVNTIDSDKKLKSAVNLLRDLPLRDIFRLLPMVIAIKRNRDNAYLSGPYFKKFANAKHMHKSLKSFFSDKFQKRLIRPLTVRNNGAEPDEILLTSFGTNISMVMDSYDQLKDGPRMLFDKFQKLVKVHLNTEIKSVVVEKNCVTGLLTKESEHIQFDYVILATPAHTSALLVADINSLLSAKLATIRYYPVGIVVSEYEKPVFDSQKRAWTFTEQSVLSNAGSYGRDRRDLVRYTFSGRTSRTLLAKNPNVEELVTIAEQEVGKHTDLSLSPRLGSVGCILSHGLCGYSADHQSLVNTIQKMLMEMKGLYVAGDYIEGVSIEGCFRSGKKAAEEVIKQIN